MLRRSLSLSPSSRLINRTSRRPKSVRIGCASGFWGDTAVSTPQLLSARCDYVVYDYLSEITMSLLARAKAKDPHGAGFCPDFVAAHLKPHLGQIERSGTKLVANAGGLNPLACARAVKAAAEEAGVDIKVAAVTGDDLMEHPEKLAGEGAGAEEKFVSLNAYLGAEGIARGLKEGASVVVTGRVADSALVLGPLMAELGWEAGDFEALATGSLAGHLVECGAQATGGVFSDWESVASGWATVGFPIAEFDSATARDSFVLTKPEGSGGAVTFGTVAEQLVYEIGDPAAYHLPDVTMDLRGVTLVQEGKDRVRVSGAVGLPPPATLKVTGTFAKGFRAIAVCPVIGPRSTAKARATAEAILRRCRLIFQQLKLGDFTKTHVQCLGSGESFGTEAETSEAVLWLAVQHSSKTALEIFAREIAPAGTGMAPGLTNIVGGRPRVSPVLRHVSLEAQRDQVSAEVHLDGDLVTSIPATVSETAEESISEADEMAELLRSLDPDALLLSAVGESESYALHQLAFTRSGDKGDTCNIGVVARHPKLFPHLKRALTAERVGEFFAHLLEDPGLVKRYELPGIHGLNFVLHKALGGGGVASLRPDPQGKAYGQMLSTIVLDGMPIVDVAEK